MMSSSIYEDKVVYAQPAVNGSIPFDPLKFH